MTDTTQTQQYVYGHCEGCGRTENEGCLENCSFKISTQTTLSEEWEKSFRRNFYSDMSGVSLDEVVDLVRLIRTAAYEKGVRDSLEVVPEDMTFEEDGKYEKMAIALDGGENMKSTIRGWNRSLKEARIAISTLLK